MKITLKCPTCDTTIDTAGSNSQINLFGGIGYQLDVVPNGWICPSKHPKPSGHSGPFELWADCPQHVRL